MTVSVATCLSRLSPVPQLPQYSGPYRVGTVDVEIPASQLSSLSPFSNLASPPLNIPQDRVPTTVLFRLFYPAQPSSGGRRISWLPAPQRTHLAAYTQLLGAGPLLSAALSFLPRHLHWAAVPAWKNADLLDPPDRGHGDDAAPGRGRWPVVIFSHGLAGCRNSYSHVAGSLASYGVVVACPEHRDGSAIATVIRELAPPGGSDDASWKSGSRGMATRTKKLVPHIRIPHETKPEIEEQRNDQLRIRLWELSLVYEALCRIDEMAPLSASPSSSSSTEPSLSSSSVSVTSSLPNQQQQQQQQEYDLTNLYLGTPSSALAQFSARLHLHQPGCVTFAGHSFGASTVFQLVKTVVYADHPSIKQHFPDGHLLPPRFVSPVSSRLAAQLDGHNPTILLDMWCFPLLARTSRPLLLLPLPGNSEYRDDKYYKAARSNVLVIESETFVNWAEHLRATARVLSAGPRAVFEPSSAAAEGGERKAVWPAAFFVPGSAHLSQSDIGLLFPWISRRVFSAAAAPDAVLRLNVRALLQHLRRNGVVVAPTSRIEMAEGWFPSRDGQAAADESAAKDDAAADNSTDDDAAILDTDARKKGRIALWEAVDFAALKGWDDAGEASTTTGDKLGGEQPGRQSVADADAAGLERDEKENEMLSAQIEPVASTGGA